jgi:hypothetical protein
MRALRCASASRSWIAAALVLGWPATAFAQAASTESPRLASVDAEDPPGQARSDEPSANEPEPYVVCIAGYHARDCLAIVNAELGLRWGRSTHESLEHGTSIGIDAGLLINVTSHDAVGVSASWRARDLFASKVVQARYRRRVGSLVGLELGAGGARARDDLARGVSRYGFAGTFALTLAESLSATADFSVFEGPNGSELAATAGFRIGAAPLVQMIGGPPRAGGSSRPWRRPTWLGGEPSYGAP